MPVEIIAEAAQGYEGSELKARMLVRGAAQAGADAVKFHILFADEVCTPNYKYRDLFKQLEMPLESWHKVAKDAKKAGLKLYADIVGDQSLEIAHMIGVDAIKIHTTDFQNDRLIQKILKRYDDKIILSMGGIGIDEVSVWLKKFGLKAGGNVCLMFGCQMEPTPIEQNNLLRIRSISEKVPGYRVGFMDHTDGATEDAMDLSLMALPLGISSIEKHITLDRELELEDFQSALEPSRFKEFVKKIRRLEAALGSPSLELTAGEKVYRYKAMKRLVASAAMTAGEVITAEKIALKRFDYEAPPEAFIYAENEAVGRVIQRAIKPGDPIIKELVK